MSCLTGPKIAEEIAAGNIEVEPFNPKWVGPNSLDVHLHPRIGVYYKGTLDARNPPPLRYKDIPDSGTVLEPGRLYLGRTVERTYTPNHVPKLGGRSSTGRLGLNIHQTAGFGDVGFNGTWTLELSVVEPVRVYPNMRIGQIWFFEVAGPKKMYEGQYQGQVDATASGGVG